MFCLEQKTTRHSPPKMKLTFDKLGAYMQKESTNSVVKGRGGFTIPNAMALGMHRAMTGHGLSEKGSNATNLVDLGDAVEEVDDDGSLDI